MMGYRVVCFTVCSTVAGGKCGLTGLFRQVSLCVAGGRGSLCVAGGRWSYYNRVVFLDRFYCTLALLLVAFIGQGGLFRQVSTVRTFIGRWPYCMVFLDRYHCTLLLGQSAFIERWPYYIGWSF